MKKLIIPILFLLLISTVLGNEALKEKNLINMSTTISISHSHDNNIYLCDSQSTNEQCTQSTYLGYYSLYEGIFWGGGPYLDKKNLSLFLEVNDIWNIQEGDTITLEFPTRNITTYLHEITGLSDYRFYIADDGSLYNDTGLIELYSINPILQNDDCDYYIGDNIILSQIQTEREYIDEPTYKQYLACLYKSPNGEVGYEEMINTRNCRRSVQSLVPITIGEYTNKLTINYQERQWNPITHQWETIGGGTDKSLEEIFTVCEIPDDIGGREAFIQWILSLLCTWFGWFCD